MSEVKACGRCAHSCWHNGKGVSCKEIVGVCSDYSKWEPATGEAKTVDGLMYKPAPVSGSAAAQSHYQVGAVQPIEYCQMVLTPEEFIGAMKFNVIKYVSRCGHKDAPVKEADKIVQYAKWLRKALNGETIKPMEDD